jgi:flagellar hook-basal body complex protein FliE
MGSIEAMGALQGVGSAGPLAPSRVASLPGQAEGDQPSFADALQRALGDVSELQGQAQDSIGAFLRGDPVEIHEVMAAAEEAGIALDMLIEIRNKLTEAYRSVIQMQQ